jgi:hypothetical protein
MRFVVRVKEELNGMLSQHLPMWLFQIRLTPYSLRSLLFGWLAYLVWFGSGVSLS